MGAHRHLHRLGNLDIVLKRIVSIGPVKRLTNPVDYMHLGHEAVKSGKAFAFKVFCDGAETPITFTDVSDRVTKEERARLLEALNGYLNHE